MRPVPRPHRRVDAGVLVPSADAQFVAEILTAAAHGP
jgi:hypothetical protein